MHFSQKQAGQQLTFGALTTGQLQGLIMNHFNRGAEYKSTNSSNRWRHFFLKDSSWLFSC